MHFITRPMSVWGRSPYGPEPGLRTSNFAGFFKPNSNVEETSCFSGRCGSVRTTSPHGPQSEFATALRRKVRSSSVTFSGGTT